MKTTLSILILCLTIGLSAQELPEGFTTTYGGKIEASETIKSPGYDKTLKWVASNYGAEKVLNSTGLIVIQASTELKESPRTMINDDDNKLFYNVELWFEGDEIKVVISNIKNYSFSAGTEPVTPLEKWYKVRKKGNTPKRFRNSIKNVQKVLSSICLELESIT